MKNRPGVRCKRDSVPHREEVRLRSYDIIGNIAVIRIEPSRKDKVRVAEALMRRHRNLRTVLMQTGAVSGRLRLRGLRWVSGVRNYETVCREHGCVFKVDLKNCYFSPRLSRERLRIASLVNAGETVVNMFAGVGAFSVLMAKLGQAGKVYSIDINPVAVELMRENARLNRVENRVVSILGDSKEVVMKHLGHTANRVVMPLPREAHTYLEYAVLALRPSGGWIHYYDFAHATKDEDPIVKARAKVEDRLQRLGVEFVVSSSRIVRSVGPRWYQVALDVRIGKNAGA